MSYAATLDTSTWGSMERPPAASRLAASDFCLVPIGSQRSHGGTDTILERLAGIRWPATPGAALGVMTPGAIMHSIQRKRELLDTYSSAVEMAIEMAAADEMDPPSPETWGFAFLALLRFAVQLQLPLLNPLQLGGLSAEWHELGMNIELRFRGVDDVFVVIEDAYGEIPEFQGRDPTLEKIAAALGCLAVRSA
jgi:hypothetical protein